MPNKLNVLLETERLNLRLPEMGDAAEIARLAGEIEIALTTLNMPHPYEESMAVEWINSIYERGDDDAQFRYVMIRREDNQLVGGCGFGLNEKHKGAEIGYWVAKPYWGNGYATEAARRIIDFCFTRFGLNRVEAGYYATNIASRRVMEKQV